MIRNVTKNTSLSYITRKKAVEDSFIDVIEKLGNGNGVRCSYSFTDS
jgi:hypothetical protein